MQANKLVIGESYAVKDRGDYREFIVTEVISIRHRAKTESVAKGYLQGTPNELKSYPVENIAGPLAEHKALMDERKAREAEAKRKSDEIKALRDRAADLLSEKNRNPA